MKLKPEHKLSLEELYVRQGVALDQLRRTPVALSAIASAFHGMTGITVEMGELLRYMINRRKNQDWPRLGERARRFKPALRSLTEHQRAALCSVYEGLDITSDEILLCPKFAKKLVAAFAAKTGTIMPVDVLVPALFQLRKRGNLPTLREQVASENKASATAFNDIIEVVKKYGTGSK